MTRHIKSVDRQHLAGVGDEGFFCDDPATTDWTRNCGEGVDTVAFARLPAVDLMSFHLYPDGLGQGPAVDATTGSPGTCGRPTRIGKPVLWGEFGWVDKATRNTVYKQWTDLFDNAGGDGWLYWILSGIQDDGTLYPDFDGFTVYCPSPVCTTLSNAGEELRGPQRSRPPVADHDTAVVEFNQPATLTPAANDVAYRTQPASELDRPRPGHHRPAAHAHRGGRHVRPRQRRAWSPSRRRRTSSARDGHSYTIQDAAGRVSNVADLSVTVKPDPTAAVPIATFETGTEGWAPGNWLPDAGTLTQTADFHPQGAFGLHLDVTAGHWFGRHLRRAAEPVRQVAGRLRAAHRSQRHVGRARPAGRCRVHLVPERGSRSSTPDTTTTITVDLFTDFSCGVDQLGEVHVLYIFFNPGSYDIDNVRAL